MSLSKPVIVRLIQKSKEEYEKLIYRILNSSGSLIGLWYPIDKAIKDGGPPWGVSISNLKDIFEKNWIIKKNHFLNYLLKKERIEKN